jgi:hypothetical protein
MVLGLSNLDHVWLGHYCVFQDPASLREEYTGAWPLAVCSIGLSQRGH